MEAAIISTIKDFWIKPEALNFGLNHFGDPNLIETSVLGGSIIMAYKQDVIDYDASHNYRKWNLNLSRTYLEKSDRCYVYARLETNGSNALVVFSYDKKDILGRVVNVDNSITGDADPNYFYILLGVLSPGVKTDGTSANRKWEEGLYTGTLATDQYIKENSEGDWNKMFQLNSVTGFIDVLKSISSATINALTVATKFIFKGKEITGIAGKGASSSSDSELTTAAYVAEQHLSKIKEDTAKEKITFAKGVRIDGQDLTGVVTGHEVATQEAELSDTDIPTGGAVVEHGNKSYLSKVNADAAKGKITFNQGADFVESGKTFNELTEGGRIDKEGNAWFENVSIRKSLTVPEIIYNRATVFKGISYHTFGGGIIESVDTTKEEFQLKLEDGEAPGVKKGDLCVGYWHFFGEPVGGKLNNDKDTDDHKGNFTIKGFATIFFRVESVTNAGVVTYSLREGYTIPPQANLHFAAYANDISEGSDYDETRHACKITTIDYELRLQNLYSWEYTSANIYRIEGKLDGFSMSAVENGISYEKSFSGHGVVFGNAYMYGTLNQFTREAWRMELSYDNDNFLSSTSNKYLRVKVYRNDVEVGYAIGSTDDNVKAGKIVKIPQWKGGTQTEYKDFSSDGRGGYHASLYDGYLGEDDSATFTVKVVVCSTGYADGKLKEIELTETVTFRRVNLRGIEKVEEYYAVNNSDTTAPTGWTKQETGKSMPKATKDNPYLWNKEKTIYTDDTSEETEPMIIATYVEGRGISEITEYYLVSARESGVTNADNYTNENGQKWSTTVQKVTKERPNLWNYEKITYTDNTSEKTTPAIVGTSIQGDKGDKGDNGVDAVQPNLLDGTSVDGTVENNVWRINIHENDSNPYRSSEHIYGTGYMMRLSSLAAGKQVRLTWDIEGNAPLKVSDKTGYVFIRTTVRMRWTNGIVQPTEHFKRVFGYVVVTINGTTYTTGTIDTGCVYAANNPVTEMYPVFKFSTSTSAPSGTSDFTETATASASGQYLYVAFRWKKQNGTHSTSGALKLTGYTSTSGDVVNRNNCTSYHTIAYDNSADHKPAVGTHNTDKNIWISTQKYDTNGPLDKSMNKVFDVPSNAEEVELEACVQNLYSNSTCYVNVKNLKAEYVREGVSTNTAYIPSENDKARFVKVNLLDGTKTGEGWTKTSSSGFSGNENTAITYSERDFAAKSTQLGNGSNTLSMVSPKVTLPSTDQPYMLSFEAKGANLYGAKVSVDSALFDLTESISVSGEWRRYTILLRKAKGETTIKFQSLLSVASGTTSELHVRDVKLEEGYFATAWTISEGDKKGLPGFTYRPCGTWDDKTIYTSTDEVKDCVWYQASGAVEGNWYVCIKTTTAGIAPTNTTYWQASNQMDFLSVEALFAGDVFANAIKSDKGYFDGLVANDVKVSGEINAKSGVFENVVVNGAYNKLVQNVTAENWKNFFFENMVTVKNANNNTFTARGTYLKSWGDVINIKHYPDSENYNIVLPSLCVYTYNGAPYYYPIIGKVKTSEGNVNMTEDDVRSLIDRVMIINNDTNKTLRITAALYKPMNIDVDTHTKVLNPYDDMVVSGSGSEWLDGYFQSNNLQSFTLEQNDCLYLTSKVVAQSVNITYWVAIGWTGVVLNRTSVKAIG